MTAQREGGCACGALRYRLASEPMFIHCCHCLNCQRQTGSAFVVNLLIGAIVAFVGAALALTLIRQRDYVAAPAGAPAPAPA